MKKYLIIKAKEGEDFSLSEPYDTLDEVTYQADLIWNKMSDEERSSYEKFEIGRGKWVQKYGSWDLTRGYETVEKYEIRKRA